MRFPVRFLVFIACSALFVVPARAAEEGSSFFIAPLAEVTGFSRKGPAFGGGLALGWGDGVSIGLRFLYSASLENFNTVEMAVFMRFYFRGPEARTGLFAQLNMGSVMYALNNKAYFPAYSGDISAGIAVGWRFPLGKRWYLEPAVRAGYPYMGGAGIAAAFRL